MQVAVFVKATPSSEAGLMPSEFTETMFAEMGRFNEALVQAGIMKDGAGLQPSANGVRVRFSGTERLVIDGPFAETKELVAGYWLWEVPSMEEAIAWVKRCPNPMPEESEIEIRPLYSAEDLAPVMSSDMQAQEEQLGDRLAMRSATVQPYLIYGGRCEEALDFYRQALHAEVGLVMRWSESPEAPPAGMLSPGYDQKIMHAEFTVGGMTLMASDGCGSPQNQQLAADGFRLALTVPTAALADRVFDALANPGGRVDMPLARTFFSPRYGMVTDPFGIGWMVMVPGQPQA
jgi:PhnB protein